MENNKIKRINSDIQKTISLIVNQKIKNKNLKYITITDVDTSRDLSYCKIYFTCLNKDDKNIVIKSLNKSSPYIRHELSKELQLRKIPELKFIYDTLIEYEYHIDKVIENANK